MNWDAVAAIAEAVGAIAVVATLVYLSLQVRQNTRSIRAQSHQHLVGLIMSLGDPVIDEIRDVTELRVQADLGLSALSRSDRERFRTYSNRYMSLFELAFYQRQAGLLTDDVWSGFLGSLERFARRPAFVEYWAEDRLAFGSEFAAFVDSFGTDAERGSER